MPGSADLLPGDHVVGFYDDEAQLATAIATKLGPSLRTGQPVLLITASAHRQAIETAFTAAGADIDAAVAAGTVVWRDATQIAAQLVSGGSLDQTVFDAAIGTLVRELSTPQQRTVNIYGEIVSVLWASGHVLAAIELERLWNRMLQEVPASLLCGYSAGVVADGDATVADYHELCAAHTRVLDGPPTATDAEVSWHFPGMPTAVREARYIVSQTMRAWRRAELAATAALIVSELASNAVQHAESAFTVSLARTGRAVRIAVGDTHPSAPHEQRSVQADQPHGRGLQLIGRLSSRWGHDVVAGGKLVWAEITAGTVANS